MLNKTKHWRVFKERGLLWATNTFLHMFGYAIIYELDKDDNLLDVYPDRIEYRGFNNRSIEQGFENLHTYLNYNIKNILKETKEGL